MFTDRERFTMMMTSMITSEKAKEQPRDVRQALLDYLRKKHCPSITDEDWADIKNEIDKTQKIIIQDAYKAMKEKPTPDELNLDTVVMQNKDDIDYKSLKTKDVGIKGTINRFSKWGKMKKD